MANVGPQMQQVLRRYGLDSLVPWLSGKIQQDASIEQIMLELYDRPEFKAAFPEIEARRKRAAETGLTLSPLSPEDILTYRTQARQLMRSFGLPPSFYDDNASLAELIVNDVSVGELNDRLQTASQRVAQAPPEVRGLFGELFGPAGDQALFEMFVDPDIAVTELENRVEQAEVGGAARRFGYDLGRGTLEDVARYNPTYDQALEVFAGLKDIERIFEETIREEEADDLELEEEGVSAGFGLDPDASEAIERRAESRTAQTAGRSGGVRDERGATSLGGAGRR